MTNSRAKGARGEREWARYLRGLGYEHARRGQQFSGSPDSPDVADGIPGTHPEVKRVERLNIHDAILQAQKDAGAAVPYVAHRRNNGEWLVTIRADDMRSFASLLIDDAM